MNWKKVIAGVAPALATALGGPLAGTAVREIASKVLGNPNASEADIEAAILANNPETLVKLRELDQTFAIKMRELGIELEKVDASDRDSARTREIAVKDWTPQVLAVAVITSFMILMFAMFKGVIPEANKDAFNILIGVLGGAVAQILSYYFGSSRGSATKDDTISDALMRKK